MRRITLFLLIASLFLACKTGDEEISQQQIIKFVNAYKGFLATTASDTAKFENRQAYLDSAIRQNDLTPEEFRTILNYFQDHPEQFEQALSMIIDSLETMTRQKRMR